MFHQRCTNLFPPCQRTLTQCRSGFRTNCTSGWRNARREIKRHTLAQNAIEAAIEAIERNGYRLSLPMQFRFPNESEAEMARYPQAQEEISRVEERGPAYTVKRRKSN